MVTTRRVLLAGSAVAGVAVLGATGALGPLARAVGVEPRTLPDQADTSLLEAVAADQQRVLAVIRGSGGPARVIAVLEAQLRRIGSTPGTSQTDGDAVAVLRQAALYRAADAVAARSTELAQLLASMSAGLSLCVSLMRLASS